MPNNPHGKENNITNETIRKSAKAMDMSYEDAAKNVRELLDVEIKEHQEGEIHGHGLDHNHDHDHS